MGAEASPLAQEELEPLYAILLAHIHERPQKMAIGRASGHGLGTVQLPVGMESFGIT